jgi:hypothetical protein
VFQEINATHPSLDSHRLLKKSMQTQAVLYRFQQDHVPHEFLLLAILSQIDRGLTHQLLL